MPNKSWVGHCYSAVTGALSVNISTGDCQVRVWTLTKAWQRRIHLGPILNGGARGTARTTHGAVVKP